MGELLYEAPIKERLPVKESEILPGDKIKIAGKQYQIREKGTILCVGAEGQLPFPVIPEETHGYVDGISLDDNSVLTLEFDEEEGPTGFTGRVLKKEEISYQKEVQAEEKEITKPSAVRVVHLPWKHTIWMCKILPSPALPAEPCLNSMQVLRRYWVK